MGFQPSGFGFGFGMIPPIFMLFFLLVIGLILFQIIRGIATWSRNNAQPVLTVDAHVVSKRTDVSRRAHNHNNGHIHHSTSTSYYITFQVESTDRMEFHVSGEEYGMLAEGDYGRLTFQGSRYHGFERNK